MLSENLIQIYEESFKKNWDKEAAQDYLTKYTLSYGDLTKEIIKNHILFERLGIKKGDSIAVSGKNSVAWVVAYMSALLYGAVTVPILDEFHHRDITHIINHSDAKLFYCDDELWRKLNFHDFENLIGVISLKSKKTLAEKEGTTLDNKITSLSNHLNRKFPDGFKKEQVKFTECSNDHLAVLCYTSGTTSMTKGVMLSLNNLCGNVLFARDNYTGLGVKLKTTLCVLPLAHTYGTAFTLLTQLAMGAKMVLLGKIPSPNIVVEACKEVKPTLLFFVPLVFEKIYKNRIEPIINRPIMKALLATPLIGSLIYRVIGRKLYNLFGGDLEEVVIGGAAMNSDVEDFFYKAKFPFLVGYGMTECAPLISYIHHKKFIPRSVGKVLEKYMEVRLEKESINDLTGEIQVRGENVMSGYYKSPEQTAETFTEDGWLKSGDLGRIDSKGNIFIVGRSKTMLLGSSGENIYPEPIESKLANMPFISECIIVQHQNRLEAWVYPDMEQKEQMNISDEDLENIMEDNRKSLNLSLSKFENISTIRISSQPFPKTPKRTIKRYCAIEDIKQQYQLIAE